MADVTIDKSKIQIQENTDLLKRLESRIEDLWGLLPIVSTTPTWVPRNFRESFAVDSSANKFYYYDFTNVAWKATDAITLAAGTGITITPSGQQYTIAADVTQIIETFTAGEAISANDAVIMGATPVSASISNFIGYTLTEDLSNAAFPSDDGLWAQTFQASAKYLQKIECEVDQEDESSMTLQIQIQTTSGGAPTGTVVSGSTASYTSTDSVASGGARFQSTALFDFSSAPVELTAGSTYAIVMRYSSSDHSSDPPRWAYTNGNTYANGAQYTRASSTWSAPNGGANDFSFKTYSSSTKGGFIFQADASSNDSRANNFIGFAPSAISAGADGSVVVMGIMSGLSGLSAGNTYYLSDTSGAISTSAGSQSRKIGIALSSTTLLIKHDNA